MKHVLLLGACLASIGAIGSSFHDWSEVFKPSFVFGAIGVIGTHIGALYSDKPGKDDE